MSIVEDVKRICLEEAKSLPGAEVIAPLPVWDNASGSMGVQIKVPRMMGTQACEAVASFTLAPHELKAPSLIRMKAKMAAACMFGNIQMQIRPVKAPKDEAEKAKQAADWVAFQSGEGVKDAD